MKLYGTRGADGSALSGLLKADDGVNELRVNPWLGYPLRLPQSNDVCRRLLDNAKPINFKLSNDCRFACARRASHNVSLHNCLKTLLCMMFVSLWKLSEQ
jgi:hypothetical protein